MTTAVNPYEQQKEKPLTPEEREAMEIEKQQREKRDKERSIKLTQSFMEPLSAEEILAAGGEKFKEGCQKYFLDQLDAMMCAVPEKPKQVRETTKEEIQEPLKELSTEETKAIPKETPKESLTVLKQTTNPDTPEKKEKLTTYAELSDIAYIDFITVPDKVDPTKTLEQISKVQLDPLAFPNFKMIADGKTPNKPTEDERIVIAYLDTHKNDSNDSRGQGIMRAKNDLKISPDIADLFRIASGRRMESKGIQYASLDEKYQTIILDTNQNLPGVSREKPEEHITDDNSLMVDAMEHLRTIKEKQASKTLETIKKKGFTIMDYFPNEENKSESSSGFGAICLKDKEGNIHFAIRGTEPTSWGDIAADLRLVMKHVPENQTQDMITFFERNLKKLPEGQKINISGHSLGGALAQIASVMYRERIIESYTFNSPGAKGLSIDPIGKMDVIRQKFEKFRDFEYNKGNNSVESRITNVRGTEGISLIANLGEDIGDFEVLLKKLDSHSITKVIEYINNLKEDSPELQRHYIGSDRKKWKSKESVEDTY